MNGYVSVGHARVFKHGDYVKDRLDQLKKLAELAYPDLLLVNR